MAEKAGSSMTVGVVGDDTDGVERALSTADLNAVVGTPRSVLDQNPDAVVVVGEQWLLKLARHRPGIPMLPVEAGAGVRSVPRKRVGDAATRLVTGNWTTDEHPLLAVDQGERRLAFLDAMLVTAEPAHISEFTITAGDDEVAQFRADGIVAATPAGTQGYARAAGTPVVPPGPMVLALAPVAPFATTLDHWVVPADDVTITVERDEATVEVLADDRTVGHAMVDDTVELSVAETLSTVRVPEGVSPFARHGAQLEKL